MRPSGTSQTGSSATMALSRRSLLGAMAASVVLPHVAAASSEPTSPGAPPGSRESMIDVGGARLWTWDSGGSGAAVILLHPATGSAAIWEHQYPALTAAGYRVIAYSRRGHYRSESGPAEDPGNSVDDLRAVADALGVSRFHLVGSAAGGFMVPDFALTDPERLLSGTIACSQAGIAERHLRTAIERLQPPAFSSLPASFRELGPKYRATDQVGVTRWEALEQFAIPGDRIRQRRTNTVNFAALEQIEVPMLVIAGGADLYMPSPLLREIADHIYGSRFVSFPDCGHSAYWEEPDQFNDAVLELLASCG